MSDMGIPHGATRNKLLNPAQTSMKKNDFEQLVREAILALPEPGRKALDNVAFVVERVVRRKKAKEVGIKVNEVLFGLYEGIPKIKRGAGYFGVLPDKITIYKKTIEEQVNNKEDLARLVRRVVWHEIGHHFGFSEKAIRKLEKKWEKENKV